MQEFICQNGEKILYTGQPDFILLEELSKGVGDIWHSSFNQGFKNVFPEIMHQNPLFWFVNDFDNLQQAVSWRINPFAFAVRKNIWLQIGGFETDYDSQFMAALDFGYRAVRYLGAVSLFVDQLFVSEPTHVVKISRVDRYRFFLKNFKKQHAFFMLYRKGFWNILEWFAFIKALLKYIKNIDNQFVTPRILQSIKVQSTVSYIIPTMMRQQYTRQLLDDLKMQTYLPTQVVIVDATPENQRNDSLYDFSNYPFDVVIQWQKTQGSCRARNEAIKLCTSDYIIFGDDDIRVFPDFIENHIRFLQTNKADACNGIDIQADNLSQDLSDLRRKYKQMPDYRLIAGVAQSFSNANSCVKTSAVKKLVGNDINFDGGYGEDSDFGLSLLKIGVTVLYNPFSPNLHLKPLSGGYRFWGSQSKILGNKRKSQPWELDVPVKFVRPVPSPTVMYGIVKQYNASQLREYKHKHFFYYLFKNNLWTLPFRFFRIPYKLLQFQKSLHYANALLKRGIRHD